MFEALAEVGDNMSNASRLMREATAEINRMRNAVECYRRQNAEHERLIGRLLELLNAEDLDGARDLVQYEYDGIHGPNG